MLTKSLGPAAGGQPEDNMLLASLPAELRGPWLRRLHPVTLRVGEVIAQADAPVTEVYFPAGSVVSLVQADLDGGTTQVGLAGHEGMVGVGAFLGRPHGATAVVVAPGPAFRSSARLVQESFEHSPQLRAALLIYAATLLSQAWQVALCNRHHAPLGQLCTLLLLVADRAAAEELALTHDVIASLLGLRRETVSQAAHRMLERGYVRYTRGRIRLVERAGLERLACACYPRLAAMVEPPAVAA